MKTTTYNKLVRDGIPQHLKNIGISLETKIIPKEERMPLLLSKLVEEATEAANAKPEKLIEEIADVQEVLDAIALDAGITPDEITAAKKEKRNKRGGFENGIFLISTTEPDKPTN